jgi:site-specific DNA recombinase
MPSRRPDVVPRALIYTRVSQDKQRGRSPAEQEAECRALCEREGWQVADVLTDDGRSASRYAKRGRPEWEKVKRRIAEDGIDVLVVWEASRGSRDLAGFVELRDLLRANGVKLSYSGRLLDLNATNDSFEAGLHALLAERESDEKSDRILRSMRANASAGRPHGRRLYGYRRVYDEATGDLASQVREPDEAEVVLEVARRHLAGESARAVIADLDARGVLPAGARWTATKVKRMLTNPAYAGKRVHRGEITDAGWPPILDERTFAACAARYEDPARPKYRGGDDVKYLLSGIARCGKCGAALYVGGRPTQRVYVCHDGNGHLSRTQPHLDAYVTTVVLDRLATLDLDDLAAEAPEAAKAHAEAVELREHLATAVEQFSARQLTAATLAEVEAKLRPQIEDAERRARAASVSPAVVDLAGEGADARWDALTVEQRRELVRVLLHVTVLPTTRPRGSNGFDPDAVRLEWRV